MAVTTFTTSVAFAVDVSNPPSGGTGSDYITNFQVTDTTFDPSNNESVDVSYELLQDATTFVYVLNSSYSVVATLAPRAARTAGNFNSTWNGTVGNTSGANALADGTYSVRAFAYDANGNAVDYDFSVLTIDTTTVSPTAPDVTGLTASPSSIEKALGETTVSFTVDQAATVDVEVLNGTNLIKDLVDSSSYTAGSHSVLWTGSNETGVSVDAGTYTVKVTATNANGTDTETTSVVITDDSEPEPDAGVIKRTDLDPNSSWDPSEDDELVIEWELNEDVDVFTIDAYECSNLNKFSTCTKEAEIVDEDNLDENVDYDDTWDGEDSNDMVDTGTYKIVFKALDDDDNVLGEVRRNLTIGYVQPEIEEAFVTKESFDNEIGEVTTLVFQLDEDANVTVEVYEGNSRVKRLIKDEEVEADEWYTVEYDGGSEDEDDYKFVITAENVDDNDVKSTEEVDFDIEEDDVSSSNKSNATMDRTTPVVFDDGEEDYIEFTYCIDSDADVSLGVYKGESTSGSADVDLLEDDAQAAGCHTISWDGTKSNGSSLRDGDYSYKLVTKTGSNRKDTEIGRFVIGNVATTPVDPVDPVDPTDPPKPSDCGAQYWDVTSVNPEMCEAITWATNAGIFNGYTDNSFQPYRVIDRMETLKVALLAFEGNFTMLPANGSNLGFADLDANAWYMPYARTAKFYGLLHGYVDSTEARPFNTINRVEFLKFALEGADSFTGYEIPGYETTGFADVQASYPQNVWYYDYAGVANAYGLYNTFYDAASGLEYLRPNDGVQRGEVALVLYRMYLAGLLN